MKKLFYVLIIAFVLATAVKTNPSKEKYVMWAKEQLKNQANNGLVNLGIDLFGDTIIDSVTRDQNDVFFSVFDSKLSTGKDVKAIGIFNHFFLLPSNGDH